ncbi:tRNA synthetase RNA-binding protein [Achromatium sp. WMS2]|nr:tRNA synthetase RNA-binding protein [Achromatium sp. WMS2]
MRLDKWLWAARFFKTRQLAIEAINGGKVHLNGRSCKPSKEINVGSQLLITKGSLEWEVTILGLNTQRRPAAEAALLYVETESSKARREQLLQQRRLAVKPGAHLVGGRPTKRDRRQLQRFTQDLE